jgi:hypothetical protein
VQSPYAFHRPVENSYLVRERDRRRWRELALPLTVLVPLGLGLLAYTWVHLEVLDAGYRIQALERQLDDSTREERKLRLEAAWLESPRQVEERAVGELGMGAPKLDQMVFWKETR